MRFVDFPQRPQELEVIGSCGQPWILGQQGHGREPTPVGQQPFQGEFSVSCAFLPRRWIVDRPCNPNRSPTCRADSESTPTVVIPPDRSPGSSTRPQWPRFLSRAASIPWASWTVSPSLPFSMRTPDQFAFGAFLGVLVSGGPALRSASSHSRKFASSRLRVSSCAKRRWKRQQLLATGQALNLHPNVPWVERLRRHRAPR